MDSIALHIAFLLIAIIGLAHSYLGEKYILIRLFKRNNLPKLFGGTNFTKNTLRFAWHLTTVAWFGLGFILILLTQQEIKVEYIGYVIATTFFIHFAVSLIASKGKHLSWTIFLLISLLVYYASIRLSRLRHVSDWLQ